MESDLPAFLQLELDLQDCGLGSGPPSVLPVTTHVTEQPTPQPLLACFAFDIFVYDLEKKILEKRGKKHAKPLQIC